MTNEEIYENVMGHKPNKEFGLKGLFSWDDIDALMTAVKNCSIPAVVERSEHLPKKSDHCVSISSEPCKYKGVCKICS